MTWEKGRRRNRKQTAHGRPTWTLAPGPPLVRPYRGDVLVSASVGPAGDLVALWANAADNAALRSVTTQPGWATFPDPTSDRPVTVRASRQAGDSVHVTPLPGLTAAKSYGRG